MSEPGSYPPPYRPDASPPPGPYQAPGPYQPPGQPGPYQGPGGYQPPGPYPAASSRPPGPGSGLPAATVPAGIAIGLALLIGLARWVGAYLNATTDSFVSWPFATLPVVVEVGLAVAGFTAALVSISAPDRRSHGAYLFLAGAAAVLGFAVNDGFYQLITLAL